MTNTTVFTMPRNTLTVLKYIKKTKLLLKKKTNKQHIVSQKHELIKNCVQQ